MAEEVLEVTLLALPDDVLVLVFRLLWPDQALLHACKRLRALCHANATAVKLLRGYEGALDAAHVAVMAGCPLLARVDATAVACDEQWPLAQLRRVRRVSVPLLWSAANVPPDTLEVAVPTDQLPASSTSWANAKALLAGLRQLACTVTLETVFVNEERLGELSAPWMTDRVRVGRLALQETLPREFSSLMGGVLSRLQCLELYLMSDKNLRAYAAVAAAPLTALKLISWGQLESLSGLPCTGLQRLEVSSCRACTTLCDVSTLSSLHALRVNDCSGLVAPGVDWSALPRLTWLDVSNCSALTRLDWSGRPPPLRHLDVSGATALGAHGLAHALAPLLAARGPKTLVASIGELSQLSDIAAACPSADDDIDLRLAGAALTPPLLREPLPSLRRLSLRRARSLRDLTPLTAAFPRLSELSLEWCQELASFEGASYLSALASLRVSDCNAMTSLAGRPHAPAASALTEVHVRDLPALASDHGLQWAGALRRLSFSRCLVLSRLDSLRELRQLTSLALYGCEAITSLEPLAAAPQLEALVVSECTQIASLAGVESLPRLKRLEVNNCGPIESLSEVSALWHLSSLHFRDLMSVTSIAGVGQLGALRELRLTEMLGLTSLRELAAAHLPRVTLMDFRFCGLKSLDGIAGATALRILDVRHCRGLTSLAGVSESVLQQLNDVGGLFC